MEDTNLRTSKIVRADGEHFLIDNETEQLIDGPDPLMVAARKNWNSLQYLHECHFNFLMAIQVGAPKDYQYDDHLKWTLAGAPKWTVKDVFEEWVRDQLEMLEVRLAELKSKMERGTPTDQHLIKLLESGDIDSPHPFAGHQINQEDYEVYEFILRKSVETLHLYQNGAYTLDEIIRYGERDA